MTEYRNFVHDFPNRCLDVLELAESQARLKQREVTLLLMAAMAGFIVPFERLHVPKHHKTNEPRPHPAGDAKTFAAAAQMLEDLLGQKFLQSSLVQPSGHDWKFKEDCRSIAGDPDDWAADLPKMTPGRGVRKVVKTIRNALAHGSIFTRGSPIDTIVLAGSNTTEPGTDFSVVAVSPEGFMYFVKAWFAFLKSNPLTAEELERALDDAA